MAYKHNKGKSMVYRTTGGQQTRKPPTIPS